MTPAAGRDPALDLFKGLACVLMVLAHSRVSIHDAPAAYLRTAGTLGAPLLFFGVAGITAAFQARRHGTAAMFRFYLAFALLGFAYNAVLRQGAIPHPDSEILQIIAMGAFVTFLLERQWAPSPAAYLALSGAAFLVHLGLSHRVPAFPLRQFLLYRGIFPLFPWLALFLAGVFAWRARPRVVALAAGAAAAALVAMAYGLGGPWRYVKWDMSLPYLDLSLLALFTLAFVARTVPAFRAGNPLGLFGTHSLLFLFAHMAMVLLLAGRLRNPYGMWLLVLGLTYVAMRAAVAANRYVARIFAHPAAWGVLGVVIWSTPFLTGNRTVELTVELAAGALFALNYPRLAGLLKRPATPASG